MIYITDLSFKYDDYVFKGLNFAFKPGEFYLLQGANGAGKTTLARVMLGLLKPYAGTVDMPEKCVMSYLPDTNGIYAELTTAQNLRFRLALYGVRPREAQAAEEKWLSTFGLADLANTHTGELSLGLRKRCAIMCACAVPSDFLVLDEPLNALDTDARNVFYSVMPELTEHGRTVLCISHGFERNFGQRIILTGNSLEAAS